MTRLIHTRLSRRALLGRGALALGSTVLPAHALRAQAVGPVMEVLSRYMAAAKDRVLPENVAEKAKHHVLDTFAAMVSGSELPPGVAALALARAQAGRPVATVVGSSVLTGPMDAALVNGVLAHADETDDSHGPSQSHPGAAVVPAALALGEERAVSGQHFLRAVTLGYDVGPRLTMALGGVEFRNESRRSTHAFAGTFGAAAAAGCVAGLTRASDALAARLRVAAGGGLRDMGPRHGPHRERLRVRRHAGPQRRDRGARRRFRLDRRRRRVLGRGQLLSRERARRRSESARRRARRALRGRQHGHQEVDRRHADPGATRRDRECCARSARSTPTT